MKTVTEMVVKEEIRYVATDGKVFLTETECKVYEKNFCRKELEAKLEQIECCQEAEDHPPVDSGEYYEYHNFYWYRPKTLEEADVIVEFYNLEVYITEADLGQWICIETDESGNYGWAHNIRHSIVYVKRLFDMLGYDVTITKKESSNV